MAAITALPIAMATAAMAMRPMVAMPTGPIAKATGLGTRRGIIGRIAILTIGRHFNIGRSGRNGSSRQLSATSTITNSASSLAVMVMAGSARMASPSRALAATPFTSTAPRASTR